jgi:hypothetical protein
VQLCDTSLWKLGYVVDRCIKSCSDNHSSRFSSSEAGCFYGILQEKTSGSILVIKYVLLFSGKFSAVQVVNST